MEDHRKVTRVQTENNNLEDSPRVFKPTAESKGKATRLRVIAGLLWFLAICAQIGAIMLLFQKPINMMWIIILIVVDLAFAIAGSVFWKKSNRLDPASEKNKFMFFMQSQLGLVVAIIAFLPLIIFILTSKNLDGKQKGILAGIAGVALIIAGISGYDFNPPSVEQYTEEANRVEWLNQGANSVYWTPSGTRYHLFDDCSYISSARTTEIFEGTVAQSRELKNITELCSRCENRAIKERGLNEEDYISSDQLLEKTNETLNNDTQNE